MNAPPTATATANECSPPGGRSQSGHPQAEARQLLPGLARYTTQARQGSRRLGDEGLRWVTSPRGNAEGRLLGGGAGRGKHLQIKGVQQPKQTPTTEERHHTDAG